MGRRRKGDKSEDLPKSIVEFELPGRGASITFTMHNSFLKRSLPLVAICLCICVSVYAQIDVGTAVQDTIRASVVSTSAKLPTVASTSPVTTIGREEIEKLGLHEMYEAVRSFAGASIKDYGGIGGIKTVSIRSLGAQHTSVTYDGITMSNIQSGQVDIGRFSLDNIGQVTLTIGQSDDIFQCARSLSSAGNLDIRTAEPNLTDKNYRASVSLEASSFHTFSPTLLYQQKIGKSWIVSLTGKFLSSRGNYPYKVVNGTTVEEHIRNNSDVKTLNGELNIYGKLGEGKLNMKTNLLHSERGLPGSVVLYNEDANERLWDKNHFSQLSYETAIGEKWCIKTNLKYSYAWNRYYDKSALYAKGFEDDNYTQVEYYGSIVTGYRPIESLFFTLAEDCFYNTLDSNIPECVFPRRLTSMTAISGRYEVPRLTVTASILGLLATESVRSGSKSPDKKRFSPSAGFSLKLTEDKDLRLRGSYKKLFRLPTFNDLYYSRVGNTSLKPERADQFNIGLTYMWSNTSRQANIFFDNISTTIDTYYNCVEDKIVAIPTLFIWRMMNVDKVDVKGVDLTAAARLISGAALSFEISLNYSFQKALDISDPESKTYRNQIPYAPVHSGGVQIIANTPWVNIGYILNGVGNRYSMTQNIARNLIDGYMEHNLSIYKKFALLGTDTLLQAEVVNLTDKSYEVIKYYPMPGRYYRFTLKIEL